MSLTAEQALQACATMMNTLDASCLASLLEGDFHYASQWVVAALGTQDGRLPREDGRMTRLHSAAASGRYP